MVEILGKVKRCTKCKEEKLLGEFNKCKNHKDGLHSSCRECCKQYYEKNKEKLCYNKKKYRKKNKEKLKLYRKNQRAKYPWKSSYVHVKERCENKKHHMYHRYGGRGIKFLMTVDDFKELWIRDKAYSMDRPSIDRKNNDGNYEYSNCQYIEMIENSTKDRWKNKK